jgi:hypothetical protein
MEISAVARVNFRTLKDMRIERGLSKLSLSNYLDASNQKDQDV